MNDIATIERRHAATQALGEPATRIVRGQVQVPTGPKASALSTVIVPSVEKNWARMMYRNYNSATVKSILEGTNGQRMFFLLQLFETMEDTWPILAKSLHEIRSAVSQLDMTFEPFAEPDKEPTPSAKEKADFVTRAMRGMRGDARIMSNGWRGTIYDIADSLFKGVSCLEIDWQRRNGDIVPQGTRWLAPYFFDYPFDPLEIDRLMLVPDGVNRDRMVDFPPDKFLISAFKSRSSSRVTEIGIARKLAPWWVYSNFAVEWLMNYTQLFGVPIRWANYGAEHVSNKATIAAMLENMGVSSWGCFPEGVELNLVEPKSSAADNPQTWVIQHADQLATLMILGQTLTSSPGEAGSRALGEVHERVKFDQLKDVAESVSATLDDQFIPALIRLNFGDTEELPTSIPDLKGGQDLNKMAERDRILIKDLGLDVKAEWFYERHDIPMPSPGDKLLDVVDFQGAFGQVGQMPPGLDGMDEEEIENRADDVVSKAPRDVQEALAALSEPVRKHYTLRLIQAKIDGEKAR